MTEANTNDPIDCGRLDVTLCTPGQRVWVASLLRIECPPEPVVIEAEVLDPYHQLCAYVRGGTKFVLSKQAAAFPTEQLAWEWNGMAALCIARDCERLARECQEKATSKEVAA